MKRPARFAVAALAAFVVGLGLLIPGRELVEYLRARWRAATVEKRREFRLRHVEGAPADFSFHLENGYGFRVDSDSGLVTKDMVGLPDTTVTLRWSRAELDTIYSTFRQLRLLDLPEPNPGFGVPPGQMSGMQPSTYVVFRVRVQGVTRRFAWDTGVHTANMPAEEWWRLVTSADEVSRIISRRPEYLALPPAYGAYL